MTLSEQSSPPSRTEVPPGGSVIAHGGWELEGWKAVLLTVWERFFPWLPVPVSRVALHVNPANGTFLAVPYTVGGIPFPRAAIGPVDILSDAAEHIRSRGIQVDVYHADDFCHGQAAVLS